MTGVTIRAVSERDVQRIAKIYGDNATNAHITVEEDAPTEQSIEEAITRADEEGLPFLVAVSGDEVLGYAYCTQHGRRSAYRFSAEESIHLAADARGRGVGIKLLRALLEACTRTPIRLLVAVIADTGDQVAVHRRCGFSQAGWLKRVGFRHGQWVDAVVMQRSIGDGTSPK